LAELEIERLRKKLIFDEEIEVKEEIPDLNISNRYYGKIDFKPKPFKLDSPVHAESPKNLALKAVNHFADISGGSLELQELSAESNKNSKVTPNGRKSAQPR
jgi:hypothetical protein